jgi:hypothetical protein
VQDSPGREVSAETIEALLAERKFIKLENVARLIGPEVKLSQDWVTIGVLVHKGPCKVSKSGTAFMTLTFGNLETKEIRVMAFGEAFTKWKDESRGAILGVLNARAMQGTGGSYAVERPGQLLRIGLSRDFGVCLGTDPRPCENYINVKYSRYCSKHFIVKPKALVRRLELSANLLPVKVEPKYMPEVAANDYGPPRAEEINALDKYLRHRKLISQDSRAPVTIDLDFSCKRKREETQGSCKRPKLI